MDGRLKLILAAVILFMVGMPISGIMRGTNPPPPDPDLAKMAKPLQSTRSHSPSDSPEPIIKEEMVFISPGEFIQGTTQGGYNERPERIVPLDGFLDWPA